MRSMNRRTFLRRAAAAAAGLAAGPLRRAARAADAAGGKKLNFLFILIDDLGWKDVSCYWPKGSKPYYETPNVDRIAKMGVRFTDGYAACTVCSPTRASIVTGKYPARLHITDWIAGHRRPFAKLRNRW